MGRSPPGSTVVSPITFSKEEQLGALEERWRLTLTGFQLKEAKPASVAELDMERMLQLGRNGL